MIGDALKVVGIVIEVMAFSGLCGTAVTAAIMCNHAITFRKKEEHLRIPIVRAQRPAVTEDNRLPAAPVFIKDVDVLSVFFPNSYIWHSSFGFGFVVDYQVR